MNRNSIVGSDRTRFGWSGKRHHAVLSLRRLLFILLRLLVTRSKEERRAVMRLSSSL